jgi:virginiamycin A acetyltransferase
VVTRDVEPYQIVAGNPARTVRQRFSDDEVAELLRIRWWDWPIEHITEHAAAIMAGNVRDLGELAPSEDR